MKFNLAFGLLFVLATTEAVGASSWWSKAGSFSGVSSDDRANDFPTVYNKWHESELERWLSDHGIPHPSPADRRDLETLVKTNWDLKVQKPLGQAADKVTDEFQSAKDWVFDSWSDSQLKAFLDYHGIVSPQPRKRDVLIKTARESYEAVATKIGETTAYPGDWLYSQWSESELKGWLDEYGWPVPQPTSRDKLIASVRRNSRLASLQAKKLTESAMNAAESATDTLSEEVFNAWSDSKLKEFLDSHGVNIPQGSKRNEVIALARKNRHYLLVKASSVSSDASSAFGAATTRAGNQYAKATEDAKMKIDDQFNAATQAWSDSHLKAFLDARGVPVPQNGKRDELIAMVRANAHKAATGWNQDNFDTWDLEHLKKYLSATKSKMATKADANRQELVKEAKKSYAKASEAGGEHLASASAALAQATRSAKDATFETWSQSDIKDYLDSYGVPTYQGSNINELRALARRQATYWKYGTNNPQDTISAKLMSTFNWALDQLKMGASSGRVQGQKAAEQATEKVGETAEKVRNKANKVHSEL